MKTPILIVLLATLVLSCEAQAQQLADRPNANARGDGTVKPKPNANGPTTQRPAQQQGRKQQLAEPPRRTEQQARTARAIERTYLLRFQNQVGLTDEQSLKLGGILSDYVQRQLALANRRTNVLQHIKDLNDQNASDDQIQPQMDLLNQTANQLVNSDRKFFNDIDPQLTVQQRARLRIFLQDTNQKIRQAIQETKQ